MSNDALPGTRENTIEVTGTLSVGIILSLSILFLFAWNPLGIDPLTATFVWLGVMFLALAGVLVFSRMGKQKGHLEARDRFFTDRGVTVAPAEMRSIFYSQDAERKYREGLIFTFNGVRDGRVSVFSVHGENDHLVMYDDAGRVVKPR